MNPQIKNKDYRSDIDGLRAIAILSVIVFHVNGALLPGGFTGVDIFFVISGFLITSHLQHEIIVGENFSFKRFYLRRIKRILPALIFMILVVLSVGYFLFTKFYFQSLGEQALSATLSYSNIYFYLSSGYFDIDSSLKPLLHTWSLGVEEQFYLVWPIILVSISFFIKNNKFILLFFVLFMMLSLILNRLYIDYLNAIFYLMPFRIFEFSVGAIVAQLQLKEKSELFEDKKIIKNIFSLIALLLVVSPMMYLSVHSEFPYINALPTVLGSGMLIFFRKTIISYLLSLRIFVFIGLISYSLYLYHWPVIVFTKYYFNNLPAITFCFLVIVLSFVMAMISYQLIEKPFRYSKNTSALILFPGMICVVLLASIAVKLTIVDSFNHNNELIEKTHSKVASERFSLFNPGGCSIATSEKPRHCNWNAENQILFVGNSHNVDGYNIFKSFLADNEKYNLITSSNSTHCQYEFQSDGSVISKNKKCIFGAAKLTEEDFISNIDILVVNFFKIQSWGVGFMPIINKMRQINPALKIIVIGGFIGVRPNRCRELINKTGDLDACKYKEYVSFFGKDEPDWVFSQSFAKSNFLYIDRVALLCGDKKQLRNCITRSGKDLLFYDGDHFSLFGARYISKLIVDKYKDRLKVMGIHQKTRIN